MHVYVSEYNMGRDLGDPVHVFIPASGCEEDINWKLPIEDQVTESTAGHVVS